MNHTAWTTREGAPAHIESIFQCADGYLWLTSADGLFRFDGVRFESFTSFGGQSLPSGRLDVVRELPGGGLAVSSATGDIAVVRKGVLRSYDESSGLPGASVMDIVSDNKGRTWAATYAGLYLLKGEHWFPFGHRLGFDKSNSLAIFVDRAGALWVSDRNSVSVLDSGKDEFRSAPRSQPFIVSISEDLQSRIWGVDPHGTLKELDRMAPDILLASDGHQKINGRSLYFDREGDGWLLGESTGVQRLIGQRGDITSRDARIETIKAEDGLVSSDITGDFLEDREGNFWMNTAKGLDRYRKNAFILVDVPEREGGNGKSLLSDNSRGLYISPWMGPLNHLTDLLRPVRGHNVPHEVSCMYRDPHGVMWLGGSKGLWRKAGPDFTFIALPVRNGKSRDVQAITSDGVDGVWVSLVGDGVYRWSRGVWKEAGGNSELPQLTAITEMTAADKTVWLGYTKNRIAVLDHNHVHMLSVRDGLAVGNVMALYQNGQIWVAGDEGLQRYDHGRFQSIISAGSIPIRKVDGIVQTSSGDLWVDLASGVVLISAVELEKAFSSPSYRVRIRHFDTRDGLSGSLASFRPLPKVVQAGDGNLWFEQAIGIAKIDPSNVLTNMVPPLVDIQSVTVDGKLMTTIVDLTLPSRPDSVRFDYTALSLTMPEKVSFRYKLDGVDDVWQDAGHRRQAFYTRLPPGTFHLHVIASNNDGVWNDTGAELTFTIPPTMIQTIWFKMLCGVAAIVLLYLLIMWRLQAVTERVKAKLSERMFERERIARELHDTLLQGLQGLLLRFETAARRIPDGGPAREMMESALTRADDVLIEARNRVRALRAEGKIVQNLPEAFESIGQAMTADTCVKFRVSVSGMPRALHPVVKDEAYWIGREALLNAFSHAQAECINVGIIFERKNLILKWTDDGLGMDKTILKIGREGHWGLKGMRERADEIASTFTIVSAPQQGTELQLRIPASVAYDTRGVRSWPQRLKHYLCADD